MTAFQFPSLRRVAVVGGGVMGRGIAQVLAQSGYEVVIFDLSEAVLESALGDIRAAFQRQVEKGRMSPEQMSESLKRLSTNSSYAGCVVDLVIEAVPERLELKQEVFQQLAKVNEPNTIFATNTSTLPITRIARSVPHPERVVGLHFFNPAPLMKLVEIIAGLETEASLPEAMMEFARNLGKTPVLVRDEPGFIVNRVARQYYLESLRCVEEGLASPEAVDRIMEATGFRMGPFRLMDLIGVDTNHAVSQNLYDSFFQADRFRPSRLQQKMVDAGRWGQKVGKGFYDSPPKP